jgi:hypothetical protein
MNMIARHTVRENYGIPRVGVLLFIKIDVIAPGNGDMYFVG